jgi:hypothetical protein
MIKEMAARNKIGQNKSHSYSCIMQLAVKHDHSYLEQRIATYLDMFVSVRNLGSVNGDMTARVLYPY